MKISRSSLALTAALTGLLGGTVVRANAAPTSSSNSSQNIRAMAGAISTTSSAKGDKHACKGKNSCKGKGGCSTGDNGCKAKNSCKGKGGCRTDGKMPA